MILLDIFNITLKVVIFKKLNNITEKYELLLL